MPKQPPQSSTELTGGRRRQREAEQVVRALQAEGPATPDELSRRVGAAYWDEQRFDQVLTWALAKGLIHDNDGRLAAA